MSSTNPKLIESWLIQLPDGTSYRVDRTKLEPVELFKTGSRTWMSNGRTKKGEVKRGR